MKYSQFLYSVGNSTRKGLIATRHALWVSRWYIVATIVFFGALTYFLRDDIKNWAFYGRFINSAIGLQVYIFLLFIKQVRETLVPWDVYTRLRIYILTLLLISIVTLAPAVIYQLLISVGIESATLRNVITIIGAVNFDATLILMVMVFYYRVRR